MAKFKALVFEEGTPHSKEEEEEKQEGKASGSKSNALLSWVRKIIKY